MKEIAQRINRRKNTVTVLVDKLIRLGFLGKTAAPYDSRVTLVSLTDYGREIMPDFREIARDLTEKTYNGFSDSERRQAMDLLARIKDNLDSGQ